MKLGKRSGGYGSRHPRRPAEVRPAGTFALPALLACANGQAELAEAAACPAAEMTTAQMNENIHWKWIFLSKKCYSRQYRVSFK